MNRLLAVHIHVERARRFVAMLVPQSPYYSLFEDGAIPVMTLKPEPMSFEGSRETLGFHVDLERLSPVELENIAQVMADEFDERKERILGEFKSGTKLPIRDSQVRRTQIRP